MPALRTAAILVAAGRGERMGGDVPKQYRRLGGHTVLGHALRRFSGHPLIDHVVAVISEEDAQLYRRSAHGLAKLGPPAQGGATRQLSVFAGLKAAAALRPHLVLIHDGARPFLSPQLIERAIAAASAHGAAVPGLAVSDTIKAVDRDGRVTETLPRNRLRAIQTPQAFQFDLILSAHRQAAEAGIVDLTDDGAVAEWAGHPLHIFEGEPDNLKLTTPADFEKAERMLSPLPETYETRTGTGFDVHAFAPGDHVWLNGVRIAHDRSLSGHSDADVGLHALTDAVLGAVGAGDIGEHFPPSDPQWKGASSELFLRHAARLVAERGGTIANLDVTLLCEAPKIGPHRQAMRQRIAEIVGIDMDRVGVKATTMEGLGFIGRHEGMAAIASATVRLPGKDHEQG